MPGAKSSKQTLVEGIVKDLTDLQTKAAALAQKVRTSTSLDTNADNVGHSLNQFSNLNGSFSALISQLQGIVAQEDAKRAADEE